MKIFFYSQTRKGRKTQRCLWYPNYLAVPFCVVWFKFFLILLTEKLPSTLFSRLISSVLLSHRHYALDVYSYRWNQAWWHIPSTWKAGARASLWAIDQSCLQREFQVSQDLFYRETLSQKQISTKALIAAFRACEWSQEQGKWKLRYLFIPHSDPSSTRTATKDCRVHTQNSPPYFLS